MMKKLGLLFIILLFLVQCKESKELELVPVRLEAKDLHRNTCKECVLTNNRKRKQAKILAYNATLSEKVCSNNRCLLRGVMQPISNFYQRGGANAYHKRCKVCQDAPKKENEAPYFNDKAWAIPYY